MAIVTVDVNKPMDEFEETQKYLEGIGIVYERWNPKQPLAKTATAEEILAAFDQPLESLKTSRNYAAADVIDIHPDTPGLEAMLDQFRQEHWHSDDEVRFIIEGRGMFHIHLPTGAVTSIEAVPGDLLSVPAGTRHWFNLCQERRIRAIRLFSDPAGWAAHYTDSGIEHENTPVCFGPAHVPRTPSTSNR